MIDLHAHILPGIDDGARDLGEAVDMCRLAAADGCEAVVATPHQRHHRWWNGDSASLAARLGELQEAIGPAPVLLPGAEIRIDLDLLEDLLERPPHDATPIAGSSYLLLEPDRGGPGAGFEDLLHEIQVAGWRPIVAHPEMISGLADDLDLLGRLHDLGVLFQITAMSVTGELSRALRRRVSAMLDHDLVDIVASDAHHADWRPPGLSAARQAIAAGWGEEAADRLTVHNPRAVIENRAVRLESVRR